MGRRGRRESRFSTDVSIGAREGVETRWSRRMTCEPRLAPLVTAAGAPHEPFHRWMHYRQGFSPELVRRFLREADGLDLRRSPAPLLDPFAGSGTFTLECARQNVRALGVEAMASLTFLSTIVGEAGVPPLPDLSDCVTWEAAADRLELPVHRAALMYAVGRRHTAAGKLNPNAPSLGAALAETVRMMRDDLGHPLPLVNPVRQGDARKLDGIDGDSIEGILTSPPYLSRHDYAKVLRPYERVYEHWHACPSAARKQAGQIAAYPGAITRREFARALPAAAVEAAEALTATGEEKLAAVVRAYFHDLLEVLAECSRVLAPGAPCWMVLGGARLKGVYVPTDLILADVAESLGLVVRAVRVARTLIPTGRKLGRLTGIAPRESVLELRKT